jgi:hypothetical protein
VLEGQEDVTEEEVEELTQHVVNTAASAPAAAAATTQKEKKKKVTIRSFVSEHEVSDCHGGDESVEFRRGGGHGKGDEESGDEEEASLELPWEGFGDAGESLGMEGDVSFNALAGWRGVH